MKNLHKKIVIIGLSGVILGGFSASAVKVYANFVIDPSSGKLVPIVPLNEKFNPNLYPKKYPKLELPREYIYKIQSKRDVLPKGNDQGMDKLLNILKNSGFELIKASGKQGVIDDFVEGLGIDILEKPQLCFKSPEKFGEYIIYLKNKPKPEEGVYRFMLWGFDGLFYFDPSKLLNMYDEAMINLYHVQRGEKKYKYKLLNFNFKNEPIIKKYKSPIEFRNIEEFLKKISDLEGRKVPGHFGSKNHGGVHEGGIYCVKIGDLIFLFQALE